MHDTELIEKAQGGDWSAFGELIRRHDAAVLTLAARFVQNADDAKDVYQEVLIRVYRGLPSFRGDSQFATWLHRITVNVCLSFVRQKKRRGPFSSEATDEDVEGGGREADEPVSDAIAPDRRAMDSEIRERITRALQILSPRQRMVFTLYHDQEYTLKEIAESLRCGEGTVKRYLYDATRAMRRELNDLL
jgi:RNA polymerase sigma-70 factor (ECF subfamily)